MTSAAAFWEFAEMDFFYDRFIPLTAYGRAQKNRKEIYSDPETVAAQLDLVDAALRILNEEAGAGGREAIEYALSRIPEPRPIGAVPPTSADIFLVKKLLINGEQLVKLIAAEVAKIFNLKFDFGDLLSRLSLGQHGEVFYLADAYCDDLKARRGSIKELEEAIKCERARINQDLSEKYGLNFFLREFVITSAAKAKIYRNAGLLTIEPHDATHFRVKPVLSQALITLMTLQGELIAEEKRLEALILKDLAREIGQHWPRIEEFIAALLLFDTAFAKARMAKDLGLVRPGLASSLAIKKGRFLPLIARCDKEDIPYTPLDFTLASPLALIYGSNMGGKTIVLKSLSFMQLATQMGFYVPAVDFQTRVYRNLILIGGRMTGEVGGLSSFGAEIFHFMTAWEKLAEPSFLVIDEFAKATNSREATALTSAIIKKLPLFAGLTTLISTHYLEVKVPAAKVALFKMHGLDDKAIRKFLQTERKAAISERIRLINRYMKYEVLPVKEVEGIYDALGIAELLGFDHEIIAEARRFLGEKCYEE